MHHANTGCCLQASPAAKPARPPGLLPWAQRVNATHEMGDLSGSSSAQRSPDCWGNGNGELHSLGMLVGTPPVPASAFKVAALLEMRAGFFQSCPNS